MVLEFRVWGSRGLGSIGLGPNSGVGVSRHLGFGGLGV